MGVQVGLVALAMVVTRSSVASLQAKQGLPLGTQVVGWVTLGKSHFHSVHLDLIAFRIEVKHIFLRDWTL